MKKILLLLLLIAGGVSTASADWYVAGVTSCLNGSADWAIDDANKMTETSTGSGIYQLVITGKSITGSGSPFEFKVTNEEWTSSYPSSNYQLYIHLSGTYTITYTFNTSNNSVNAEAVRTSGTEEIYLRSNKSWDHDNNYKFTQTSGIYTLSVDVSDISDLFYYRFHIDGWGKDLCPNNNTKDHYEIASGLLLEYNLQLRGDGYYHDNNGDASNFALPLNTKPLGKIDLTIKVINDRMVLSMQGYEKVTPNASGYCTFVNYYPLTIPSSTAYYATDNENGNATAHAITNPDAGTPMLIKGTPSTPIHFAVAESGTDVSSTNAFKAGPVTGLASEDGGYNYILNGDAFYAANGKNVASGKAYLQLSVPATARPLIFEDEETTGITNVKDVKNNLYYNLRGVKVDQPTKGLYIVNGRKVVVK